MPSLWSKYLAERDRKEVIEAEHGFAVFSIKDPRVCYLEELFVDPDHRHKGLSRVLADAVSRIALDRGCIALVGSVRIKNDPEESKTAARTCMGLIQYGMQPYEASALSDGDGQLLMFRKLLKEPE